MMKIYKPYQIQKVDDLIYSFKTENNVVYKVDFEFNDRFFDEYCSSCKDILEVDISCNLTNSPKDYRVGASIFEIFTEVLSETCNGIMYRCDDEDGRKCSRELQFDRWFDTFNTDEKIDKFAQEFCDNLGCDKYTILVDKNCLNYPQIVNDFNYRCENC